MDIGFLSNEDQKAVKRLFSISGCTDLMVKKESDSILTSLNHDEFIRACRNVSYDDIAISSAKKDEFQMSECIQVAARHSNQNVLGYFLQSKPLLFNIPEAGTGNLPLHTYLKYHTLTKTRQANRPHDI
jgi:hypothetical protein